LRERQREKERAREKGVKGEKDGKYLELLKDRWHLKNDSLLLTFC
jgi:hypothetical protein